MLTIFRAHTRPVMIINISINHTINKNELDNFVSLDNFHLHACLFSSCLSREPSCQSLFVSVWGGGALLLTQHRVQHESPVKSSKPEVKLVEIQLNKNKDGIGFIAECHSWSVGERVQYLQRHALSSDVSNGNICGRLIYTQWLKPESVENLTLDPGFKRPQFQCSKSTVACGQNSKTGNITSQLQN